MGGKPRVRFPKYCSLSLSFVRCIPEINTMALILSLLSCLFFLLFTNFLAFISTTANNSVGHLYDPCDPIMSTTHTLSATMTAAIEKKTNGLSEALRGGEKCALMKRHVVENITTTTRPSTTPECKLQL